MLPDEHAVPADFAANGEYRLLFVGKNLREHQGIHRAARRVAARIAEARLWLAESEMVVQLIRALSLEVVFWRVNCHANFFLHRCQQGLGFWKFPGLKCRPDR